MIEHVKLNLEAEKPLEEQVIGVAIRLSNGKVYSQRHPTTHEALVEVVKEQTGAEFWADVDHAVWGMMTDEGRFIPRKEP